MDFRAHKPSDAPAIERLFVAVFSKSEGEQEGALIGNLVKEMIATTDSRDLYGFVPVDGNRLLVRYSSADCPSRRTLIY